MQNNHQRVKQINDLLPQTQCGECGYAGCQPYAEAIALKGEAINKCPPGGVVTLGKLSALLHQDATPYIDSMQRKQRPPQIAQIREDECIGCTKCIQACPVDAIIGSAKKMHVILSQECTGCGLCVPVCPVDCIDLTLVAENHYDREKALQRYRARQLRLSSRAEVHVPIANASKESTFISDKKRLIAEAIIRAKSKKQKEKPRT